MSDDAGSLMFVPIPRCRPVPGHEQYLKEALGDQAAQAVPLASKTRLLGADEAAFESYMVILCVIGSGRLSSEWGNPFNSSETFKWADARGELAATIWNYISLCQSRFAATDPTSEESLRSGREILSKLIALGEIYRKVVQDLGHPFFTAKTADFLRDYHAYICSLFQLACCEIKKATNMLVKSGLRCLEQARLMDRTILGCCNECRTYFRIIFELIKKYFQGYCYWQLAGQCLNDGQHGKAIACLRQGEGAIGAIKSDQCFAGQIVTSVSMLKANIRSLCQKEMTANSTVYNQFVPESVPFPEPFSLHAINPDPELMAKFGTGSVVAPTYDQIESSVAQSALSATMYPVFVPSPVPPVFTPNSPPQSPPVVIQQPVFTPTSSPSMVPGRTQSATYIKPVTSTDLAPKPAPVANDASFFRTSGYPTAVDQIGAGMSLNEDDYPSIDDVDIDIGKIATVDLVPVPGDGPAAFTQNPYADLVLSSSQETFGSDLFPQWRIVMSMKAGVLERIEYLKMARPQKLGMLMGYESLIRQAEQVDAKIHGFVQGWGISPGPSQDEIQASIDVATNFYNALEMKLDEVD